MNKIINYIKGSNAKFIISQIFNCVMACCVLLAACGSGLGTTADATSGTMRAIQNKGSDTLVNLALAWAEAYQDVEPDVSIAVTGGGSGTGIASLINGTVDIANASREMKDEEIEAAQANNIDPVEYTVAIDALAVVVHPDNPVNELTIEQLADIYTGRITNWQEIGGMTPRSYCSHARQIQGRTFTSWKKWSGKVTMKTRTSSRRKHC